MVVGGGSAMVATLTVATTGTTLLTQSLRRVVACRHSAALVGQQVWLLMFDMLPPRQLGYADLLRPSAAHVAMRNTCVRSCP